MAEHPKHLYMIVYPINALVSSQLNPERFGEHYILGGAKHFDGKMVFVELDIEFRDPYFDIDHYLALTVPHPDGMPKRTKFISSYGVLEHVDLKALKNLYLVLPNGKSLPLTRTPYTTENQPGLVRVYQEITPLTNLVASTLDQRSFAKWITRDTRSKGCPKILFTQYTFDVEQFLAHHIDRQKAIVTSPFPNTNATRLFDFLTELKSQPDKRTKTISLASAFGEASFAMIRHGFWFASGDELAFYPMPSLAELNDKYYYWWKYVA
jgi:hypothetical protein